MKQRPRAVDAAVKASTRGAGPILLCDGRSKSLVRSSVSSSRAAKRGERDQQQTGQCKSVPHFSFRPHNDIAFSGERKRVRCNAGLGSLLLGEKHLSEVGDNDARVVLVLE